MTFRSLLFVGFFFTCASPFALAQPEADNPKSPPPSGANQNQSVLPKAAPKAKVFKAPLVVDTLIVQIDDPGDGSVVGDMRRKLAAAQGELEQAKRILNEFRTRQALTVLANPTMHFGEAMPGAYFVGDEREIQYMVPAENGLFRLTTTKPTRLGMELSLKAKSDRVTNRIALDPVELSLYAIEGREQVAGTELAIGKPRITRKSVSTSMELDANQFGLVELQISEKRQVWVMLSAALAKDTDVVNSAELK